MHSHLFLLGNNPALSVAEILAKFQSQKYSLLNKQILKLDFSEKIDTEKVIKKLGGTIKIVEVLEEDFQDLLAAIEKYLPENFQGKYGFGLSFYGEGQRNFKEMAMKIKRELKSRGISSRWIVSREKNLSSVVVDKNKLVESGSDFVIVEEKNKKFLGKTVAVQNFEELSLRDYGRPARDSYSGMIPPKLAQMMLNIGLQGRTDQVLLDPFCGSGTMLMEASLMGVKKIIGTDLSEKAIHDSQVNLRWLKKEFQTSQVRNVELKQIDARKISNFLNKKSVDLIVTEPYLGPQRKIDDIEKVKKSLEKLYQECLIEFSEILNDRGRIVMIWPVLRKAKDQFMKINLKDFEIVNYLPENLNLPISHRNTLVYGRKDQKVWREIVVLEKK
jgi:tRNA G10  N-methylase Trm11